MAGSVYGVREINTYIKNMFDQDFLLRRVRVKGEVSNCKYHSSGHIYFSLKEEGSLLTCVMFASGRSRGLSFAMSDGMQVTVTGTVSVYERDGKYQMYATLIEEEGQGELYRRFLARKQYLEEMGMFSPEYKKPIPRFCKRIGIVTAATGAAIHDIITTAKRRNPYVELFLYPAKVQGTGAAASVAHGIEVLDAMGLDCLIVGRGGGSIEDLWAFNEEIVARAVFEAATPVISAVGHETDVTIADFVSDKRAATPTAAAELAVFRYEEAEELLEGYRQQLVMMMSHRIMEKQAQLRQYRLRLESNAPKVRLQSYRTGLEQRRQRLHRQMERGIYENRSRLQQLAGRLEVVSPVRRLSRGFGYVTSAGSGDSIKSIREVAAGDRLGIYLKDGYLEADVIKKEKLSYGEE